MLSSARNASYTPLCPQCAREVILVLMTIRYARLVANIRSEG
jgi:hypothetical protein